MGIELAEVVAGLQGSDPSDVLLKHASEVLLIGYFSLFTQVLRLRAAC